MAEFLQRKREEKEITLRKARDLDAGEEEWKTLLTSAVWLTDNTAGGSYEKDSIHDPCGDDGAWPGFHCLCV